MFNMCITYKYKHCTICAYANRELCTSSRFCKIVETKSTSMAFISASVESGPFVLLRRRRRYRRR